MVNGGGSGEEEEGNLSAQESSNDQGTSVAFGSGDIWKEDQSVEKRSQGGGAIAKKGFV